MNTDASTVEDRNIHQVTERLSMSCIAFSGERSNIFRSRSFTLFKNERDFRERSDSAAVSESISSSMTNLLDTGLSVLVPEISPDFLTWEDHLSSLFHSEEFDELAPKTGLPELVCCSFNELRGTFWLSDFVFTGFSDAVEASTVGSLTRYLDTKFVIGFDFAVTLSSSASSCFPYFMSFLSNVDNINNCQIQWSRVKLECDSRWLSDSWRMRKNLWPNNSQCLSHFAALWHNLSC